MSRRENRPNADVDGPDGPEEDLNPPTRKVARLDHVLIELGFVDEGQIQQALERQARHGGRLGMNLVRMGVISEEQLLAALARQFQLPTRIPEAQKISRDLIEKMPPEAVVTGSVLPLAWNAKEETLTLAVANPSDQALITRVMEAFGAKRIRVMLAPERQLAAICEQLVPDELLPEDGSVGEGESESSKKGDDLAPAPMETQEDLEPVVMVTRWASRGELLPPLFEKEGYSLRVVNSFDDAKSAISAGNVRHVLISEEMRSDLPRDDAERVLGGEGMEIKFFSGVSEALLKNPLPYESIVRSLRSSVQALADYRSFRHGAAPPYRLIAFDVEALAHRLSLPRVIVDGLHLAVHLLVPASRKTALRRRSGEVDEEAVGPYADFGSSLELASRLRFPWRLDAVMNASRDLFRGEVAPADSDIWSRETILAAQLLSVAWHRHVHLDIPVGSEEEAMVFLRTALTQEVGQLASSEIVESYLDLISERGSALSDQVDEQVVLVGGDRLSRGLAPALEALGRDTLMTDHLSDAQGIVERRPPAAIVVDEEVFPGDVEKFGRVAKLGGSSLIFAVTNSTDPKLVMDLLDVGLDDVFGPPHDFTLIAARVSRAIRSRMQAMAKEQAPTGRFSATFEVFSFLDLIQMLSQGMKSVRIDLNRDDHERAVIFMEKGRIVHALGGGTVGEEVLYRVIGWEDEGEFTVSEERSFPAPTIERATDSLLMEGLRLLDESKRS